jgi:multicomponent Na+:H+ antiporter subunit F
MIVEGLIINFSSKLTLFVLLLSILIVFIRLLKGPSAADRIVALDLISILVVAFLAAYSVYSKERAFLDVAISYALIAFLGTVAFARFLGRVTENKRKETHSKNDT